MFPPMSASEESTIAGTDPEVRREIIETVRRFVAKEVIPVASEFEREDRFPAEIVAQMRDARPVRRHHPRASTAGSASTS